jgi:UDPglucose 6-dehydrogenase
LNAVLEINAAQRRRVIRLLRASIGSLEGRAVALLGLAFKPGTDDIREAPSLDLARLLINEGAIVRAYDPVAMPAFGAMFPDVVLATSALDAVRNVDAAVIVTEWPEFADLDLAAMRDVMSNPLIADCRNHLDREAVRRAGFTYYGVGTAVEERRPPARRAARSSRRRTPVAP